MPTVETNGVETHYEDHGDGQPIVFVHGASSDHRIWAERAAPLAEAFRVIVYDVRGHGYTGGTGEGYGFDAYVEDLHALVDALDLERPVVCGLSMGGMIGIAYAARYPEDLGGLVTLGARTPQTFSRTEWVVTRGVPRFISAASRVVDPDRVEAAVHWLFDRVFGEETGGDIEAAERIQAEYDPDVPEMTEAEGERMTAALEEYAGMTLDYDSISAPTLTMYGDREMAMAAEHARFLADRVAGAEARTIPEAGHNSHVDNPAFVRETVSEFVRERVEGNSPT